MEVVFYDHVIIGHPAEDRSKAYFSFRERGLL
jgi:DNA repair protein RadC